MQRFVSIFALSALMIKGSISLANTDVAIIEFREGSAIVDYYVAQQLDRVYETLPIESSIELELVPQREINLYYQKSAMLSKERSLSVANYFIRKGLDASRVSFNSYRKGLYVETVSYNDFQELNSALIFRPKVTRSKSPPLRFTHSGANPFESNCLNQSINSAQENELYHPNGASVSIPANAFETESGLAMPSTSVDIQFCVYIDAADFLMADITSNATKRWLESGGMVFIEAFSGKEKLRLKSLTQIGNPKGMIVFTGENRYNIVNWNPSPKDEVVKKMKRDTAYVEDLFTGEMAIFLEDGLEEEYDEFQGYLLKVGNLGWINCDRFLDIQNTTDLMVNVSGGSRGMAVRMVFEKLNSVLPGYSINTSGTVKFDGVPTDEAVTVLAFGKQDGKPMWAEQRFVLGSSKELDLTPRSMSETQIKAEMAKFGN
jgi:hypothetical protein